jgi:secondary thiamine-phosphate synthase enzyme
MNILNETIPVSTNKRCQMVDITSQVAKAVNNSGIADGDCIVFCKHTTAAITINENADPDVMGDILLTLEELLPKDRKGYRHNEGNSDSHVKSSLFGCSEQILIKNGSLLLGTWQGIYFCEFDGPRSRSVWLQLRGQ